MRKERVDEGRYRGITGRVRHWSLIEGIEQRVEVRIGGRETTSVILIDGRRERGEGKGSGRRNKEKFLMQLKEVKERMMRKVRE